MRFLLTFKLKKDCENTLPLIYNYYLYSYFMNVLSENNPEFGKFLHDTGYKNGNLKFKFFTFSRIIFDKFSFESDHIKVQGNEFKLYFSIDIPEVCDSFINSFLYYKDKERFIGDKERRVYCYFSEIERVPETVSSLDIFYTNQPVLVSVKRGDNGSFYLNPWLHSNYISVLEKNISNKYTAKFKKDVPEFSIQIQNLSELKERIDMKNLSFYEQVKLAKSLDVFFRSLVYGRYKLFGFQYNFKVITDSEDLVKFIYINGLGCKNTHGFGFVERIGGDK